VGKEGPVIVDLMDKHKYVIGRDLRPGKTLELEPDSTKVRLGIPSSETSISPKHSCEWQI